MRGVWSKRPYLKNKKVPSRHKLAIIRLGVLVALIFTFFAPQVVNYSHPSVTNAFGSPGNTVYIVAGTGGSIVSPSSPQSVSSGGSLTIIAAPNSGYAFSGYTSNVGTVSCSTYGSNEERCIDSGIYGSGTFTANFAASSSYTITASILGQGTISPSGSVQVTGGNNQTFNITPDTNYQISAVLVDGTDIGTASSYTFDDVETAHTIEAEFSPVTYALTISQNGSGTVDPSGEVQVDYGGDEVIDITPADGYYYAGYTSNGSVGCSSGGSDLVCTVSDITSNEYFTVNFDPVYNITANAVGSGSIDPSGDVAVDSGNNQTFNITPDTDYQISNVIVDETSVGVVSSYTFDDVTATHTIEADFAPVTYPITATAVGNGSIDPSGDVEADEASDQTFNITPDPDNQISDVIVDDASVGVVSSYTFDDVETAHTIEADFSPITETIVATAVGNGTIDPSGSVTVDEGSGQLFNITPDANYQISNVIVDETSVGVVSSYTFDNVTIGHTIKADFSPVTFVLKASAGSGGSVSPSGAITVDYGGSQVIKVTPDKGYSITGHTTNGTVNCVTSGKNQSCTVSNITSDEYFKADFAAIPVTPPASLTISASVSGPGAITPIGGVSVVSGADQSFTITPNSGDVISQVLVDGANQGALSTYTFSDVTAAHTIEAIFTTPVLPAGTTTTTSNGKGTGGATKSANQSAAAPTASNSKPIKTATRAVTRIVTRYVYVFFNRVPKLVVTSFPWLLLILLLLMVLWAMRQSWLENKLVKYRSEILAEEKQLSQTKETFLELVTHYLRTPLTKLTAGIELMAMTNPGLSVQSRLKLQADNIQEAAKQILAGINPEVIAKSAEPPFVTTDKIIKRARNRLWLMVYIIGVLGFLIDILVHGARHIHTSTITLATHAAIYALLVFVLYGTLRYSNIQHNRRVATDGLLTNQDNLDSARNDVIRTAYQNLSEPVAAISLTAKVLVNDSPASNSILAALDEFRSILDKLKTVIELKNVPLEATQSINLLSVLQPATTALFQAIDAKHLSVNYAPGIANQSVLADPVLLDKIVTSILDNAVKFSPERGSIDIGYVVAHDSMSLTIKDQGQGIDPGYMARLFQPFSRAEANALTFNYEGIGLSLYTAKLLARCLHGDIDLSSLSGQGTTVAIKLPKPKKSVLANTNQSPINAQPASAMAHSVAL